MKTHVTIVTFAFLILSLPLAVAESFHLFDVGKLEFAPDQDGLKDVLDMSARYRHNSGLPTIGLRVPAGVEAYVALRPLEGEQTQPRREPLKNLQIAVRFSNQEPVSGFLDVLDVLDLSEQSGKQG